MAAAAHALKGAAAMLRADEVRRVAADLERIGRSEDLSQASQSVDALRKEVRQCLDYLPEARALVAETARARTGGAE
jgi:HPt (histidine-containing phosphotransfer) domain-containing protein